MNKPGSHTPLWEDCLTLIRKEVSASEYDLWFKDISEVSHVGNDLKLMVPTPLFAEHIEANYLDIIGPILHRVYGPDVQLHYLFNVVSKEPDTQVDVASTPRSKAVTTPAVANPFAPRPVGSVDPQLNPRFTFENYCVSSSNKNALIIAESLANDPQVKTFNPLFIFGDTGVGKTHLIQAIGIRLKERFPDMRVVYLTSRTFQSQFTTAHMRGETNQFFNFYQSIDTLIVDDIQDLNDKPKTQNMFYNIFNYLHLNNKQIVLSSDRAPADMKGIEARMLGRFKWGISVRLERPDLQLRRHILSQKAASEGIELPDDVMTYIANNVTDSIRDIEGVMTSIVARATFCNIPVSLELARNVVGNAIRTTRRSTEFDDVLREVCSYYNVEQSLVFTSSRKREISDARQMVMYLAKQLAKMSFKAIGQRLGRSHATVLYGCRQIEERIPYEKQLQEASDTITKTLLS